MKEGDHVKKGGHVLTGVKKIDSCEQKIFQLWKIRTDQILGEKKYLVKKNTWW